MMAMLMSLGNSTAAIAKDRRPAAEQKSPPTDLPGSRRAISHPVSGLKLTQVCRNHGLFVIYVSPTFLRAVNEPNQCEIISSAPDWTIWLINSQSKCYFSESLNQWLDSGLSSMSLASGPHPAISQTSNFNRSTHLVGNVKFQDIACHKYQVRDRGLRTDVGLLAHERSSTVHKIGWRLIAMADPKFKTPSRILNVLFNAPTSDELPFSFMDCYTEHLVDLLRTRTVSKQPITGYHFTPPPGFTRTKTIREAFVSSQRLKDIEDLGKALDLGEKFGSNR